MQTRGDYLLLNRGHTEQGLRLHPDSTAKKITLENLECLACHEKSFARLDSQTNGLEASNSFDRNLKSISWGFALGLTMIITTSLFSL
jgi:hypothetical protein